MPVRRDRTGRWRYRETVTLPNGKRERISGTAPKHSNTKLAAQQALRDHVARAGDPNHARKAKTMPTFHEWWHGRFWSEWVVGRKNKPPEVRSKRSSYKHYLHEWFGALPLDEIDTALVAQFRAYLVGLELSDKSINNILAHVSKPLKYAVDVDLLAKAPRIGLFKVERPEVIAWDFDEYARVLAASKAQGPEWYAAVALAGEAGLRIGEVKELRWREDVDMTARTITINRQICRGLVTTPKGRTRRTVPMTPMLYDVLRRLEFIREGLVIRDHDGKGKTDGDANYAIQRICARAGLPVRFWHVLRHSFGTHAALFGVNPWRLQTWLGHKRIDETMIYVHVAEHHGRDIPDHVQAAAAAETDPDRRVLAMLGARGKRLTNHPSAAGETAAKTHT